jgi:hypothetical protein
MPERTPEEMSERTKEVLYERDRGIYLGLARIVYNRIFGDFLAKNTVLKPYIWFWPTLHTFALQYKCLEEQRRRPWEDPSPPLSSIQLNTHKHSIQFAHIKTHTNTAFS